VQEKIERLTADRVVEQVGETHGVVSVDALV